MSARSEQIVLSQDYQPEDLDQLSKQMMATFECIRTHESNRVLSGLDSAAPTTPSTQATSQFTSSGLDSDISNQVTAGQVVEVVSDNGGDTMDVTIYGTDTSDEAQSETLTLTGLVAAVGTKLWNSIHGAIIASAPTGTVTLQNSPGGTAILTLTSGALTKGLDAEAKTIAIDTIKVTADAATTKLITYIGTDESDAALIETVQLDGTNEVETTNEFKTLTHVAVGELEAARTATHVTSTGACAWRVNTAEGAVVVDGVYGSIAVAADYAVHATTAINGLAVGTSVVAAIVAKNVAGTISVDAVIGTPATTGSQVPPTDAVIQAELGADVSWVRLTDATLNRTADTTLTQSQDNTVRPILGVNVPYALGDL